jgi:hypothetical protein
MHWIVDLAIEVDQILQVGNLAPHTKSIKAEALFNAHYLGQKRKYIC